LFAGYGWRKNRQEKKKKKKEDTERERFIEGERKYLDQVW
jgi:hypothetical protein